MLDQVNEDIKTAMRAKDKPRLEAVRMLKSSLLENQTSKSPKKPEDVAISHVKKLKDALGSFPAGSEEAEKLAAEISFLTPYIPQPMDEAEVREMISALIREQPEAAFGAIMKEISPKIKGRFDGK